MFPGAEFCKNRSGSIKIYDSAPWHRGAEGNNGGFAYVEECRFSQDFRY